MKTSLCRTIEKTILILLAIRPSLDLFTSMAGLGALKFNPASLLSLFLITGGAIWIAAVDCETRKRALLAPLTLLLGAWIFLLAPWAFFPVIQHGMERIAGAREWVRLFSYLPIVIILSSLADRGQVKTILNYILISAIVPAIVGVYQIAFHQGAMIKDAHRIMGTFVHPNPFSFYIVLLIGLAYWQWRWTDRKAPWTFALIALFILLLATYSFTGAGMFGILVLICAIGENKTIRRIVFAALLLFIIGFLSTSTGRQRILEVASVDRLDEIERTGRETSSLTWRLLNWRFLYRTWLESPWFGHGLASCPRVNPMLNPRGVGSDPHNDYVRYLTETGAVGLPLFLALVVGVGVILWKAFRRMGDPTARHFILVTLAIYASWIAGSFNDNLITATSYQYCLWAVFAAAASYKDQREPPLVEAPS